MTAFRPPLYAWAALLICAALLVTHGPIKAMNPATTLDTPLLLSAAATWRQGGNPYDTDSIAEIFAKKSIPIADALGRGAQAFVYPPPAYYVLSPLTYLPWATQFWVWSWLNVAMLVASLLCVSKLAGIKLRSRAGFAILGIGLACYPARLNISFGQTAILMFFFMSLSWILAPGNGRNVRRSGFFLSALAMGLAAAVKPQIVVVLAMGDLFSSRRMVATAGGAIAAILFFGSLAVHGDASQIIHSWVGNMSALMQADANPLLFDQYHAPHDLINLQSPLAVLTGNRLIASTLALVACALMAGWYLWSANKNPVTPTDREKTWLNDLSAGVVLMLLIFYHRSYDAIFLMIPVAFAIRQILAAEKGAYILLAMLLQPMIASPRNFISLIHSDTSVVPNRVVESLFAQYQTWAMVAAFFLLCQARRRAASAEQSIALGRQGTMSPEEKTLSKNGTSPAAKRRFFMIICLCMSVLPSAWTRRAS